MVLELLEVLGVLACATLQNSVSPSGSDPGAGVAHTCEWMAHVETSLLFAVP